MPDPLYVRARRALLDAADALGPHLDAAVLVGAQAVYQHTGDGDLATAEYTTDADFALSPRDLADEPLLGVLFNRAGFTARVHPGGWLSPDGIYVDIMVPEALAGPGTQGRGSVPMASASLGGPRDSRGPSSIETGTRSLPSIRQIRGT